MQKLTKQFKNFVRRYTDLYSFWGEAERFSEFLDSVPPLPPRASTSAKKVVGFMIAPWHYTAVPWFSIALAYLYAFRGYESWVLWDDCNLDDIKRQQHQNGVIGRVLEKVSKTLKVVRITELDGSSLDSEDEKTIEKLGLLNAIKFLKSSVLTAEHREYCKKIQPILRENLGRIKTLLQQQNFDHIVIPGGIYGNSGLFMMAAQRAAVKTATYDAGYGVLVTGNNSVAAHHMSCAKIFEMDLFNQNDPETKRRAIAIAKKELHRRMTGGGIPATHKVVSFQSASFDSNAKIENFDVLIPLNIDWDSAALGAHNYFAHSQEWVFETVKFILENTTASVAIRQHPVERDPFFKSRHDLKGEFAACFDRSPRLRFFSAEENVNTYNLIEHCRVVLPFTSSTGVEAAILGKHVIVESEAYYSYLPFVEKACSRQDYFDKIKSALARREGLSADKVESALLCYFSREVANFIPTRFNSQPSDFASWFEKGFQAILNDPMTDVVFRSLSQGTPVYKLRAEELLKQASSSVSQNA